MSKTWKIAVGVLVLVVLVVGWKFMRSSKSVVTKVENNTQNSQTTGTTNNSLVNSNTSLDEDSSAIDAQMKLIDSSSASVDQSFNDTPIPQTE